MENNKWLHLQTVGLQYLQFYLTFVYGVLATFYILYKWGMDITLNRNNSLHQSEEKKLSTKDSVRVLPKLLSSPEFGEHKFIKLKDVKLHYVESGCHEDPLLLLIHGCPDFWFTWRKQIPFLARNFWVIALDLRGCGDSDKPSYRNKYSDDIIAQDIADFITAIGGSRARIVVSGTSGQAVWKLAYKYSDLIYKMVLVNAPHPFAVRQHLITKKMQFLFKLWYLHLSYWPFIPELLISSRVSRILDDLLAPLISSKKVTEEEIECYKYNYMWRDDWIGALNYVRNFDIKNIWNRDNEDPEVLAIPTMIIMGDSDSYLPLEVAYRTAEFVERIQVKRIEGSDGRWSHITHSSEINSLLNKFLVDKPKLISTTSHDGPSLMGRMMGAGLAAVSNTVTRTTSAVELTKNIPSGFVGVANSTLNTLKTPAKIWTST